MGRSIGGGGWGVQYCEVRLGARPKFVEVYSGVASIGRSIRCGPVLGGQKGELCGIFMEHNLGFRKQTQKFIRTLNHRMEDECPLYRWG